MADGNEYVLIQLKEKGQQLDAISPTEGSPLIIGPNAIFKEAPSPNAARLFQSFCFTPEAQQLIIDVGAHAFGAPADQGKSRAASRCPRSRR